MYRILEYKEIKVAEINEDLHSKHMRYWTEDNKNISMPAENITSYLCWIENDKSWDAIQAMKMNDGYHLFGQAFRHKEYALRWLANEYDDTDDLVKEDRKAGM